MLRFLFWRSAIMCAEIVAACSPSLADDVQRFETYVTADASTRAAALASSAVWSLFGPIDQPGIRLKIDGFASVYGETNANVFSSEPLAKRPSKGRSQRCIRSQQRFYLSCRSFSNGFGRTSPAGLDDDTAFRLSPSMRPAASTVQRSAPECRTSSGRTPWRDLGRAPCGRRSCLSAHC